eukprot:g20135.t1
MVLKEDAVSVAELCRKIAPGRAVCVLEGRKFANFSGGEVGRVLSIDFDSQLCLVQFRGRPPVEVPVRHLRASEDREDHEATQPSAPSAPVAVEPSTQPEVDVAAYVPPADEDGQADTPEEAGRLEGVLRRVGAFWDVQVGREAEARSADESETAEEAASNSAWLSTAAPQPSRMMTEVASSDDSPEEVDGLASEDDLQLDAIPAGGLEEAASTAAPYPAFSEQEAEGSDSAWVSTAAQYPAASNGEREEASAAEQEVCSGGDEAETASAASAQPAPEEVGDQSAWPQQAFAEGQQVDWPDEASDAQQAADASLWEEEASAKGEQEGWPDQTLADGQKEEGSAVRHEADCPDETPADTQKAADASLREEEASAKGEQEEGAALRDEVDWPDETPQKVDAPSGQEETSEAEQVDWPNEASVDAQQVDWPDEASADAQQVDWPDEASAEGQTEQASDAAVWPPEAGSSLAWPDASERTRQVGLAQFQAAVVLFPPALAGRCPACLARSFRKDAAGRQCICLATAIPRKAGGRCPTFLAKS